MRQGPRAILSTVTDCTIAESSSRACRRHPHLSGSSSRWTRLPDLFHSVNNVSEIEVSEA